MFNLTVLQIAAISTVPCSAIGASSYIGYQYYLTNSAKDGASPLLADDLSDDVIDKKLQLKNQESLLISKEVLLKAEQAKKADLEIGLTHFEIALKKKIKADIELKKSDFVRDIEAKEAHEATLLDITNKKQAAKSEEDKQQGLVDGQKQEIEKAKQAHANQVALEAQDLKAKQNAEKAFTNASSAFSTQLEKEVAPKKAVDDNATNIQTHTQSIAAEEAKTTDLTTKQTQAAEALVEGKTTCDTAISSYVEGKACDDQTPITSDNVTVTEALATYQKLKEAEATAKKELSELSNKIQGLKSQLEAANNAKHSLQNALDAVTEESKTFKQAKDDAEKAKDAKTNAHSTSQALTITLDGKHTEEKNKLQPLEQALEKAKGVYGGLEQQLTTLNNQTQAINVRYEESKKAFETIVESISTKDEAVAIANSKVSAIDSEISDKQATLVNSTPPAGIETKSLSEINQSIKEHKDGLASIELKIADFQKEINSLKVNIQNISSEILQTSKEIDASTRISD